MKITIEVDINPSVKVFPPFLAEYVRDEVERHLMSPNSVFGEWVKSVTSPDTTKLPEVYGDDESSAWNEALTAYARKGLSTRASQSPTDPIDPDEPEPFTAEYIAAESITAKTADIEKDMYARGIWPHECTDPYCHEMVQYDDEPWCFTHSPNSGSSVPGYSAKKNASA